MKTTPLVLLLLSSALVYADALDDPWPMVPALPTGCYGDDGFTERTWAANEVLENARQQQADVNDALQAQLRDMDMAEVQQRMMDYMMKNPQDAQRAMETMYGAQASTATTEGILANADQALALESEMNALQEEYQAAVAAADASVADPPGAKEGDWCSVSDADYRAWIERYNAAYRSMCTAWWPGNGKFNEWMGRWRSYLNERVVFENNIHETARYNLGIYDIPVDNYRSMAAIKAALEFLNRAGALFGKRRAGPMVEPAYDTC